VGRRLVPTRRMLVLIDSMWLRAFVGALMAGPISDKISRKRSISLWCILFMLGTALQVGLAEILDGCQSEWLMSPPRSTRSVRPTMSTSSGLEDGLPVWLLERCRCWYPCTMESSPHLVSEVPSSLYNNWPLPSAFSSHIGLATARIS